MRKATSYTFGEIVRVNKDGEGKVVADTFTLHGEIVEVKLPGVSTPLAYFPGIDTIERVAVAA